MKTRFLLLLLMPFICLAQVKDGGLPKQKETDCALEAKQADSLVKLADYDAAYKILKNTTCISESHYFSLEKVLTAKLATNLSDTDRQTYVGELLKLYTTDDKNFPGNRHSNLVKRAQALQKYKGDKTDEVFNLLDRAFKEDRANFTDAAALYQYFQFYIAKFKAGEKGFTEENLIEKQDDLLIQLSKSGEDKSDARTATKNILASTGKILTCEKLEAYYEKKFDANKTNIEWLAQAAGNLIAKNCTAAQTATKLASAWYGLQPDARSAYAMGEVSIRSKNNQAKAPAYFNESAEKQTDAVKKSETYLMLASLFTSSDIVKSIGYVKQAIALRPDYGRPYLLLAQLFVTTGCGETPFEKKALYQLAAETVRKAAVTDPTMKKTTDISSAEYLKKAPTKAEIKEARMNGKTVTFGCGVDQSVTFPK